MLMRTRASAGDTIVEVIVVLAVLGLAISVSYATANRSLKSTRAAHENAQATAVLQSQLESLRYILPTIVTIPSGGFCVDTATNTLVADSVSPCTPGIVTTDGTFPVSIKYDGTVASGGTNTFTLVSTWDDYQPGVKDSVTIVYRPYN